MNVVHTASPDLPSGFVDGRQTRAGADEINLRAILGTLDYRRWRVLIPALAGGAIATFLALQMPDYYGSSTQVMLNASESNLVDIDSVITTLPGDSRLIEGEIALMFSNDTLHRVAERLGLYHDPEFADVAESSAEAQAVPSHAETPNTSGPDSGGPGTELTPAMIGTIDNLRGAISVSQVGMSLVISITATSLDSDKAAAIADAVAEQYIASQVNVRLSATQEAADWIGGRVDALRRSLEEAEMAVEAAKATIVAADGQTSEVTAQQLTETNSQLVVAKARRAEADARMDEIERRMESAGSSAVELLVSTPSVTRLRTEIDSLVAQRSELTTQFGASYPRLQSIGTQIADLQRRLDEEIARAVSAVSGEAAAARAREEEMAANLAQLEQRLSAQASKTLELRQLERVAEADRTIYETFLARLNELTQQVGILRPDARVISFAAPSDEPWGPNRKFIVLGGTLLGLLLGGAFVFLTEAVRSSFLTDLDLSEGLGVRTLARLPRLRRRMSQLKVLEFERNNPYSRIGQATRDISVSLIGAGGAPIGTILVTSARRREGRTTLCLLTASALTRLQKAAVVVECDLSNPTLADIFGCDGGNDIVDVLLHGAPLESAVRTDPESGIAFLPVIGHKGYGPELLYGHAFERLLTELGKRYDSVILDAAPLSVSPDACATSRMVDFVIVAVQWGATSRELVKKAMGELQRAGAPRLGAVLTLIGQRRETAYRRKVYNIREA